MIRMPRISRGYSWVPAIALIATLEAACSSDDGPGNYCVDPGDLNSDNVIDGADCDLVAIGRATRALCESTPDLWLASDACGASRVTKFANDPPFMRTWDFKGRGFVSVNQDEIRAEFPPAPPSISWTTFSFPRGLGAEAEATAAVSTSSQFLIADNRNAWFDENDNGEVEAPEFIDLVPIFGAPLHRAPLMAARDGSIIVAGRRRDLLDAQLQIWKDRDGNLSFDANEKAVLDSLTEALRIGVENNHDAIVFRSSDGGENVWIDRNDDWIVQPEEISSTGRQTPCVRYWAYSLCEDWERRVYDVQDLTPRLLETPSRPTAVYDSPLEIHYGTWLWRDTNSSRMMEPWEIVRIATLRDSTLGDIRYVDGEPAVHVVTQPLEVVDGIESYPLVGLSRYVATAFLGGPCNATTLCAGELRCTEVSGATGQRCVE